MSDNVKRFLGRVYLIPISIESLTHSKRQVHRGPSRVPFLHTSASQVSIPDAPNRTYDDDCHLGGRCPISGKEEL
jgi:hypothetical protein